MVSLLSMLPPSPRELEYFLELVKTPNISRAAERLGITQPTLTLALQRLEDSVGSPLFVRTKSGVILTHAGEKLAPHIRNLILQWDRICTESVKDAKEIRGRYTLGCHPSVALYALPKFLSNLMQTYPDLDIKLVHELSRKITEEVITFRVDFGIVINAWDHPDLVIRPITEDIVQLYTRKNPTELQDPKSNNAVLIADLDLLQSQDILKQLSAHNLNFRRILPSSNLEVVASLVASGTGIGILPSRVAGRIRSMDLVPLMKKGPQFHDRLSLVYRADAQNTEASRALARLIEEKLSADKNIF